MTRMVVLVGVLFLLLHAVVAAEAARYPRITVYVEGKEAANHLTILDHTITNALVVDGHPLVAARFADFALKDDLDIHLFPFWGFFKLDILEFKLGAKQVYRYVPMMGGGAAQGWNLPLAPRVIEGRLYVPALPTLQLLGHKPEWDPQQRTLRLVLRGEGPRRYGF